MMMMAISPVTNNSLAMGGLGVLPGESVGVLPVAPSKTTPVAPQAPQYDVFAPSASLSDEVFSGQAHQGDSLQLHATQGTKAQPRAVAEASAVASPPVSSPSEGVPADKKQTPLEVKPPSVDPEENKRRAQVADQILQKTSGDFSVEKDPVKANALLEGAWADLKQTGLSIEELGRCAKELDKLDAQIPVLQAEWDAAHQSAKGNKLVSGGVTNGSSSGAVSASTASSAIAPVANA